MDLLKAQLERISQQLSGLTASQKMLAAALVAIMVMTLIWSARYAGVSDTEPLLNQSFSADDISQITTHLSEKDIPYTVSGDRIMIPTDRRIEILADLGYSHLLPQKTDTAFDDIVKQMNPFDPEDKTKQLWLEEKQRTLESVLNDFPNVTSAAVVIDPSDERRLDGHDVYSSAMVSIATHDMADSNRSARQIASAAADVVAGATAGLNRSRVTVVIDGTTIPISDKSAQDGLQDSDDMIQTIRANEDLYVEQIKSQLGYITSAPVFVSVRVDLNTKKTEIDETKIDPKVIQGQLTQEDQSTDTSSSGGASEPGAASNTGSNGPLSVGAPSGGGGGGGSTSSETDSKATFENKFGGSVTHVVQGPGDAPPVSAAVRVPRSYFVDFYKTTHNGADPDQTALDTLVKDELGHILQDVKNCTGITDDSKVTVNWYADGGAAANTAPMPVVTSPVVSLLESHVRDIGVGGLAAFSLLMVMMMVRKSSPAPLPVAIAAAADKGPQRLQADSNVAGEVSEGEKTMEGMEMDDESVKTQQVIEQVSDMVSENPDAAANLVKRWLNRP